MPIIQTWELSQYQYAAEQMCFRIGVSPYEAVNTVDGTQPAWMQYAVRMHELRLMVEMMRNAGVPL
jgi:hypothetical protein